MNYFASLVIHHQHTKLPIPTDQLISIASKIYKKEKISLKQATHVIFCSDYMIKKLNANYRNKNKPTDVLSFELKDVDMFGEIYISLQRATIQARRFGISYDEEILRLFVHGLFHLQGYDHEIESEREKMEKMEQKYINF